MKKPTLVSIQRLDYNECVKWVEYKLGKDLQNYAGIIWGQENGIPYLNFWHWIMDHCPPRKGKLWLQVVDFNEYFNPPPWVKEILACFVEEFGEYIEGEHIIFHSS